MAVAISDRVAAEIRAGIAPIRVFDIVCAFNFDPTEWSYLMELDNLDRSILNIIQSGFPVDPHPYQVIADGAGVTEEEAYRRVMAMKQGGVIRRIGASYDSRGLNFTSTLCSVKVPPELIDTVVAKINSYGEVTHNYQRNHAYNIWFTVIAETPARISQILKEIQDATGCAEIRNMPAIKKFKIKVDFKFKDGKETAPAAAEDEE